MTTWLTFAPHVNYHQVFRVDDIVHLESWDRAIYVTLRNIPKPYMVEFATAAQAAHELNKIMLTLHHKADHILISGDGGGTKTNADGQ
jgi:hypothetical protein